MKCPRCQTHNREGAKFCHSCGEKLERYCSQCGSLLQPSAKFCDQCGAPTLPRVGLPEQYAHPESFTPRALADKILGSRTYIEGERKLVTALFSDVANYTSISEKLDPEEIHRIMEGCLKLLMDQIYRFEGIVTQFVGDGILALFGAPIAHEDHAQRACYAALSIQKALGEYSDLLRRNSGIEFAMKVGIHSGLVMVGSIGDDLRMDYTALGDTINLAFRLQEAARPGSVFVSKETQRMTEPFFRFHPLGRIALKGKGESVEAYELIEAGPVATRIGAALARGLHKFVGREHELPYLQRVFEKVRAGAGHLVALVGEAGIGKSRLILELRRTLDKDEYQYLEGRCHPFGGSTAYLPIRDILRCSFDLPENLPEHPTKAKMVEMIRSLDPRLLSILPPLHDLLCLTVNDDAYQKLEPKQKREKTFEALRDWLLRLSQEKPLLITLEDLQWVDKTSEEFLTYLISGLAHAPVLLLLLYRPEYVHPWGNLSFYDKIGLDRLSVEAARELLGSLLAREASEDLSHLILGRTGGNPLFIEEFTNALVEKGFIVEREGRYVLSRSLSDIQVPDTVQGIIAARIDRLEPPLKRTLQLASVIGRSFPFSILQRIMGAEADLKSYLLELQKLEFVYEKTLFPELEYEFKHALLQEVAYHGLLLSRRREIHEKIGQAIEALYPDRIEERYEMLAYHYSKSENLEKAHRYQKLSGIKAMEDSALWEAFHFYREAIESVKRKPSSFENRKEILDIARLIASPMISLGFPEDSLEILQEAEKLSRELNLSKSLITFSSMQGLYYSVKGDPLTGAEYGEQCFESAEKTEDIELVAPIAFDLCSNYAARGLFPKVIDLAPRILSRLEEKGKESESFGRGYNIFSALSAFHGFSIGYMGDFGQGQALCQKAIEGARNAGNLYSLGMAELFHGFLDALQGQGAPAAEHFRRSIDSLERGQIFVLLGLAWAGLGWAHYFEGELEKALTYIEKGLKIHEASKINYDVSVPYYMSATVYSELDDTGKALQEAQNALRLARQNHEFYYEGVSSVVLGRILTRMGPPEIVGAEALIDRGIEIAQSLRARPQWAIGLLARAELYLSLDEKDKALYPIETAEAMFRSMKMDYWLKRTERVSKMVKR